ncbi:hypothetical protein KIPB_014891 [Kipferlia bialata]|uniref:Uncharacterized protein n=1 Tax=Kipferlia bialata TaxID=797122 RepID=A0A391PB85_9EUKA|nr:hypothetical protein KIPB_014891 [Kipferlia bialata]|eukprot:g14891.t1
MGGFSARDISPGEGKSGPLSDMWHWCGDTGWTRTGDTPCTMVSSEVVGDATQDAVLLFRDYGNGTETFRYSPGDQQWEGPCSVRPLSGEDMREMGRFPQPYRSCALSAKRILYITKGYFGSTLRLWLINAVSGECVQCESIPGLVSGSTAACLINPYTLLVVGDHMPEGRYRSQDSVWLVEVDPVWLNGEEELE